MDDYTEYLNKRVMELAFDVGKLQGTLRVIAKCYDDSLPEFALKHIERVLKETEGAPLVNKITPLTSEVPVKHNRAPQVKVSEELV